MGDQLQLAAHQQIGQGRTVQGACSQFTLNGDHRQESGPQTSLDSIFDGLKGIQFHLNLEPLHIQLGPQ